MKISGTQSLWGKKRRQKSEKHKSTTKFTVQMEISESSKIIRLGLILHFDFSQYDLMSYQITRGRDKNI